MTTPTRILLSDDLYALEEERMKPPRISGEEKARLSRELGLDHRMPVAPGTEPPRERPEAERAGRLILWSLACGVVAVVVWWAV